MKSADVQVERVWRDFADQLGGFLRSRVGDATVAEDLRQDVFLKLYKRIRAGDKIQDLRAWLNRAARNAAIDHYRTRKVMVDLDDQSLPEVQPHLPDLDLLLASFRGMIYALPDGTREAVLLADIERLPQKEVAERLGISLSAVKSRILRGRKMLRENLERCCLLERDRRGAVIDCTPRGKGRCVDCS